MIYCAEFYDSDNKLIRKFVTANSAEAIRVKLIRAGLHIKSINLASDSNQAGSTKSLGDICSLDEKDALEVLLKCPSTEISSILEGYSKSELRVLYRKFVDVPMRDSITKAELILCIREYVWAAIRTRDLTKTLY